jgi:hypothetical protein
LIARKDVVAIVGHCCNKRGGIWFNIERAIKFELDRTRTGCTIEGFIQNSSDLTNASPVDDRKISSDSSVSPTSVATVVIRIVSTMAPEAPIL